MSVRNLHDDVWQIDIRIGRKDRFRKNVRASSKLQAVLIEQEYRKQLGREIGDIYSINSIAPEYLEYVKNHQSSKTYKEKFRKPEPEIYPLAPKRLNVEPTECIFIDDREKNFAPAINLGMKTVLFTSTEQTIRDVNYIIDSSK